MIQHKNKAFTLVELIIVITILAILATIGFISYLSYTVDSRNSKRTTDLGELKTGLDIYQVKKAILPDPDNASTITMDGLKVISYQGYASGGVLKNIKANGDFLDPKDKNFYTYSVNDKKDSYEVLSLLEKGSDFGGFISNIFGDNISGGKYIDRYKYAIYGTIPAGIYTDKSTQIPLQELTGTLNLSNNWSDFNKYEKNDSSNKTTLSLYDNMFRYFQTSGEYLDTLNFSNDIFELGGKLFFSSNEKLTSIDISGNTNVLRDFSSLPVIQYGSDFFVKYNNKLYYNNSLFNTISYIDEFGNTGSIIGTTGINASSSYIYNNKLYFTSTGSTIGNELFYIDQSNTLGSIDINPGRSSSSPGIFNEYNNKLYFVATKSGIGEELFYIDQSNTLGSIDINPGRSSSSPRSFEIFNNKLYFSAIKSGIGQELLYIDSGNNLGIIDITTGRTGSYPKDLVVYNNKLYFEANKAGIGWELLYIDSGNNLGYFDIYSGRTSSNATNLTIYNNKLYLTANKSGIGTELFYIDTGNNLGYFDIYSGRTSSSPYDLTVYNNKMYFGATKPGIGVELFYLDLQNNLGYYDLTPGTGNTSPFFMSYLVNGNLYLSSFFTGYDLSFITPEGNVTKIPNINYW